MGDVGLAIQRAEDKTAQMQARAGAIDELLASGALEDHVGGGRRTTSRPSSTGSARGTDIESELARMKGELAAGAPKQLEANGDGSAPAPPRPRRRWSQPTQAGDGS